MIKGIILALSACFLWGLVFVIPKYLYGFSPAEIAFTRHFFNGALSLAIFGALCLKKEMRYSKFLWLKAFQFSLIVNILFFIFVVMGVQLADAAITTLIVGVAPITIAFYGGLKEGNCNFKTLTLSGIFIFIGLFLINAEDLLNSNTSLTTNNYALGILFAALGLVAWTWYIVANTQLLKAHPTLSHFEWASMLGVATLFWVVLGYTILTLFILEPSQLQKYTSFSDEFNVFLLGTSFLGFFSSWLGTYLWNSGCTSLPISVSGSLSIFQTLFALVFVYVLEQKMPSIMEISGISIIFLAILYCVRGSSKAEPTLENI